MTDAGVWQPIVFPGRRHFVAATVFFVLVAIYGSLVPWNFTPLSVRDAALRFKDLPMLELGIESRADWVSNILLFLPIGYCFMASTVVGREWRLFRTILCGAGIWIFCAALSIAIEFTQIWFPPRTTSQNDIQAECIGAAAGILLAACSAARLAHWLRWVTSKRQPHSRLVWLLQVYVAGLLVYEILPLDVTISPGEIWQKYKLGRIEIVPFSSWRFDFATLSGITNDLLLHIPLGAWCALGPLGGGMRKEDFWRAVLWSAGIVAACELAQTFIYSRYAASTDVLVSTLGAAIGAYAAIRATSCQSVEMTESTAKRRDVFWIAIAGFFVLYAAFLCVVYWGPFEVLEDPVRIERRLRNFLSVPFAKLYWGTEYNAVTQMLGKFFSFMPFGIAAAVGLRRLSLRSRGVWWIATTLIVLAFAAFGCAMELVQAIFPPHLPDITDAMFYTSGTLGGLLLGRYVLGDGRPTPI